MTASLDNSQINLHYIRDLAFEDFEKILLTPDKKALVFEQDLIPYIELFVSKTQLAAWNVVSYHFLINT